MLWHRREILYEPFAPPAPPLLADNVQRGLDTLRGAAREASSGPVAALLRATALRALARASNAPADVELLLEQLTPARLGDLPGDAILALGLLRRSDPSQRLLPELLVRVRGTLVHALRDTSVPAAARIFAALGLGLLADQGAGEGLTEQVLVPLAEAMEQPDADLARAALVALGMHAPTRGTAPIAKRVRALALGGEDTSRTAQALVALAAWSDQGLEAHLLDHLRAGGKSPRIQRAAALGLSLPASHLSARALAQRVDELLAAASRELDATARDYALLGTYRQAALRQDASDEDLVRAWAAHAAMPSGLPPARFKAEPRGAGARMRRAVAGALVELWTMRQLQGANRSNRERAQERARLWAAHDIDPTQGSVSSGYGQTFKAVWLTPKGRLRMCRRLAPSGITPDYKGASPTSGWDAFGLALLAERGKVEHDLLLATARAAVEGDAKVFATARRAPPLLGLGLARLSAINDVLLARLAADGQDPLQAEIAVALGRTAVDSTIPGLIGLATDRRGSDGVRRLAYAALGARLDPERTASVALLLERLDYRDSTEWVTTLYGML